MYVYVKHLETAVNEEFSASSLMTGRITGASLKSKDILCAKQTRRVHYSHFESIGGRAKAAG